MEDNTILETEQFPGPHTPGDFIRDTIFIYNAYFLKVIIITIIAGIPGLVLTFVKDQYILGNSDEVFSISYIVIKLFSFICDFIIPPLSAGLVICLLIGHFLHREISIYEAIKLIIKKAKVLIGSSLLRLFLSVICMITVIGIPFAIYLTISWSFVPQIAIIESYSISQTLTRSRELVKGYWWHMFGVFLFTLLPLFFSLYLTYIVEYQIPNFIHIFVWPLFSILFFLIYVHIRVQKEQYTLEKLKAEFEALENL